MIRFSAPSKKPNSVIQSSCTVYTTTPGILWQLLQVLRQVGRGKYWCSINTEMEETHNISLTIQEQRKFGKHITRSFSLLTVQFKEAIFGTLHYTGRKEGLV